MSGLERKVEATRSLLDAFGVDPNGPSGQDQTLLNLFNLPQKESTTSDIYRFIDKVKHRDRAQAKSIEKQILALRQSETLSRPDDIATFLVKCRTQHTFYASSRGTAPAVKNSPVDAGGAKPPTSPFIRRSASRDPVANGRLVVKEEPLTPTYHYRNGPVSGRRSLSSLHAQQQAMKQSPQTTPAMVRRETDLPGTGGSAYPPSGDTHFAGNPLFNNKMDSPYSTNSGSSRTTVIHRSEPPKYSQLPLHSRMGTSPGVPHEVLCNELIGALQGIEGSYFVKHRETELVVSRTCAVEEGEALILESLLVVANQYLALQKAAKIRTYDATANAFNAALSVLLEDYVSDMADLRSLIRSQSLLEISFKVEEWRSYMALLERVVYLGDGSHSPNDVISKLYEFYRCCDSDIATQIVTKLLDYTVTVFCNSLRQWLKTGCIDPKNKSWMIEQSEDGSSRIRCVPVFLKPWMAQIILKIGKSQRYVEACADAVALGRFRTLVDVEIDAPLLYSEEHLVRLTHLLREMSSAVCATVVRSLLTEHKLMEHLRTARTYLMVEDPNFSHALYTRINEVTQNMMTRLSPDEAGKALLFAVAQSTASTMTSPAGIRPRIETIVSARSDYGSFRSDHAATAALRPQYNVSGICEGVFDGTEEKYEAVFNTIWSMERQMMAVEDAREELWIAVDEARLMWPMLLPLLRYFSVVLCEFARYLLQLRQLALEVTSRQFDVLSARLETVIDIDEAAQEHHKYLDGILSSLFIDRSNTSTKIGSHLVVLLNLANECCELFVGLRNQWNLEKTTRKRATMSSPSQGASDTLREFEMVEESVRRRDAEQSLTKFNLYALRNVRTKMLTNLSDLRKELELLEDHPDLKSWLLLVDIKTD